jgi:hypothetical protein
MSVGRGQRHSSSRHRHPIEFHPYLVTAIENGQCWILERTRRPYSEKGTWVLGVINCEPVCPFGWKDPLAK